MGHSSRHMDETEQRLGSSAGLKPSFVLCALPISWERAEAARETSAPLQAYELFCKRMPHTTGVKRHACRRLTCGHVKHWSGVRLARWRTGGGAAGGWAGGRRGGQSASGPVGWWIALSKGGAVGSVGGRAGTAGQWGEQSASGRVFCWIAGSKGGAVGSVGGLAGKLGQ